MAIGIGGDADTLACIAGAVAEAIRGVPRGDRRKGRAHLADDLGEVLDRFELRRPLPDPLRD